jgi:uncharacterized membrane protein
MLKRIDHSIAMANVIINNQVVMLPVQSNAIQIIFDNKSDEVISADVLMTYLNITNSPS